MSTTAPGAAQELHESRLEGLSRAWNNAPGWKGQLTAVNHSTVGLRFIITGFAFLLVGGLLAMFIRLQLAWFDNEVLDPARYNQFVTMHGTTMMFLFAVPILEGFAMYLIPKMIGARDLPFPRLSAFGYWCYLFGGLFLYSSFLFDAAPDGGWFMYVPLTDATFSPGLGPDFWLLGVTFAEIAAVTAAVELVVAILVTRAPGMSLQRMPLFAWAVLITAFMIAFGFPPLILASILLEMQRAFGFVFFDVALGGDPLLWQHLFWLFGHPDVYIIFMPAAGVVSMVLATFVQRAIVGYTWIVMALVTTGFLSFGLWVHHMFAVGIPLLSLAFFSAASMAVAVPTGVQMFAWLATLWAGRPRLRLPMLYLAGFFVIFTLGGLTGVMLAFVPFDWQAHDTHFVVAHLHYVLIGGMMFPLFAGLYYWLPLVSGRMPSENLGRSAFWMVFIGFNLTFLPMHITGLAGMTRRVYTYSPVMGVEWLNLFSTAASFVMAAGMVAILVDVVLALMHGRRARLNPWKAGTLEWTMGWPVPQYNFASHPVVAGRYPVWDDPELPAVVARTDGMLGVANDGRRELLGTSLLGARPEQVIRISSSTWLPLIAAALIAGLLTAFIAKLYWLAALALLPLAATLAVWQWTTGDRNAPERVEILPGSSLPTQYSCTNAPGWWATVISLLVDGSLFASLLFAYFYLWLGAPQWPTLAADASAWMTVGGALLALAAGTWCARMRLDPQGAPRNLGARLRLPASAVLGGVFLALHLGWLWAFLGAPQAGAYASVVWTVVGFHAVHVAVAMLMSLLVWARQQKGYVHAARPLEARVLAAFWRYTLAQGVLALAVVHLFPVLT